MSVQLVLKNSSVQDKEATAAQLAVGELALNYHSSGPFLQCEDSAGNIWRLGGVVIASTAPSSPSRGAWWLDSDDNHLYFYNGSSWIEIQTGEIVPGDITEGTARQLLQTNAAGNGTEWTSNIDVPGTLDVTGVATFDNNVVITGNLTVNGTTTTIDTTTLVVEDKNIELGVVGTPTDTTADGGGITVKGATDKTLTWVNSTGMWTSNQPFDVAGEVQCDSLDVDGDADITGTVTLHGNLDLQDNDRILLGADDDLDILHNGTNSVINNYTGKLILENYSDDKDIELKTDNGGGSTTTYILCDGSSGAVNLNHYGSNKLATTSTGINVTGEVQCDSLDVDGAADITGNVTLHADLDLQDGDRILLGTGDDFQIQHDGATSSINNFTENLVLQNYADDRDIELKTDNGAGGVTTYLLCDGSNGQVNLYYYGSGKLNTTSTGINVTGSVTCDGLTSDDSIVVNSGIGTVFIRDNNSSGTASQAQVAFRDSGSTDLGQIGYLDNANSSIYIKNSVSGYGVIFGTNNTARCQVNADGHFVPNINNAYDLGTSSLQWRDAYFDGTVNCDGLTVEGDATISTTTGILRIRDSDSTGGSVRNYIVGEDSGANSRWYIGMTDATNEQLRIINQANSDVIFYTNGSPRCYVSNSGNFEPNNSGTQSLGGVNRWNTLWVEDVNFSGFVKGVERTATASSFDMSTGNFWTFGAIAVPNPTNQSAGMMGSLRVTAAPTSFAANWKFPGGSYTAPTSFPAVAPFFVQASGTILVGSWTEGIA